MININKTTCLSPYEQEICKIIAKNRYKNSRLNNIKNSKVGDQSNEFTDLEGFAGEFAFCKLFNLFPDFSVNIKSSNINDLGDVSLNNLNIDIKTTKYKNGKLLVALWKKENTDVDAYALMVGEFPKYTFKGFMLSDKLFDSTRIKNLGKGDAYIAYQSELKDLYQILKEKK